MLESLRGTAQRGIRWLSADLVFLLAMLVVVVCVLVFFETARAVSAGTTQSLDEKIVIALRDPSDPSRQTLLGPPWLREMGRDLTALGGVPCLTLITTFVAGYLLLTRKYGSLALLLAAILGGLLLSTLLKEVFHRPRPSVVPHHSFVDSPSFPSGHSMLSAVVYLTLGTLLDRLVQSLRLKFYFLGVALLLSFLVGLSRVYMGVHYPTDVLAGWAAGLTWAVLCWLTARYLQRRGAVEKPT
jgi:undecaprenyl-diphosphatase